jgi:hypothetical protein
MYHSPDPNWLILSAFDDKEEHKSDKVTLVKVTFFVCIVYFESILNPEKMPAEM